jgi:hypothetical protein
VSRIVVSLVAGLTLLWWALGPWVPFALVALLLIPRARWWVLDRLPQRSWRTAGLAGLAVALLAGLVVVVPDGWLPIPPSPGVLVHPAYVGRPVVARPVRAEAPPAHPHLAPTGRTSSHGDAWASGAYPWAGPMGRQPEVDTAWLGLEQCAATAWDSHDRMVALCGEPSASTLRIIDPDTMRPVATKELPARPDDGHAPEACREGAFHLDDADRAVLATAERRVLAVDTSDAEDEPDLTTDETWDLSGVVPDDDCLVALMPDWEGRIWWASAGGRLGTLDPRTGRIDAFDVGAPIANSLAVDARGGVYVVTVEAAYRFTSGPGGRIQLLWRSAYDRGSERKPGQLSQGSGSTPTLVDDAVVITDNAEPRMHVVFLDRDSGEEICRAPVFADDASATDSSPVSVGSGVVVPNNHGYASPLSTLLGRSTSPGLTRIDLVDGECVETWSSDLVAPSSVVKVSWPTGVVYAYTKQPTWSGVSSWYLTAVDAHTGERIYAVRTGTGVLYDNHRAAITLAPDGAAWIATVAGLVRVRDRSSDGAAD